MKIYEKRTQAGRCDSANLSPFLLVASEISMGNSIIFQ